MRWAWVIFWGIAGIGMIVSGFFVDWFVVDFTFFKMNLGWFAALYGALSVWRNVGLQQEMALTDRELHDYGERLSQATPLILQRAKEGVRPRVIARELEERFGIPEVVGLKYMVVLSRVRLKPDSECTPEGEAPKS